jgi:hypothetical protein
MIAMNALQLSRTVLVLHFIFVLGVILPVPLILVGAWRRWRWIRNRKLRFLHFIMIGIVALEALIGIVCPLTEWEQGLRRAAGEQSYEGSFVGYWISRLLYYEFEPWVFTLAYCFWVVLVLALYFLIPPQPSSADRL